MILFTLFRGAKILRPRQCSRLFHARRMVQECQRRGDPRLQVGGTDRLRRESGRQVPL